MAGNIVPEDSVPRGGATCSSSFVVLSEFKGGVRLSVHVQPGARRSGVTGVHGDSLKLAVSTPPVDGKANEAVNALVASLFAVPLRNVQVAAGVTSRRKTVQVEGVSLALAEQRLRLALRDVPEVNAGEKGHVRRGRGR